MKTFIVLSLFAANVFAAEFSGTWEGRGLLKDKIGKADCIITIDIEQTTESLKIKKELLRCAGSTTGEEVQELEVVGTELFKEGKKVGELTEDSINLSSSVGLSKNNKSYKRVGNTMSFLTRWESRLSGVLTVSGKLKKIK